MFRFVFVRGPIATLIALGMAALTPGCSTNTDPSTPQYWIERLDDETQRTEALRELGKMGAPEAVAPVVELLELEGEWQPDAAYTLGQLGDASVVPALIQQLDFQVGAGSDRTTALKNRTNQNIARALAALKAKEGVEPLINLLGSREDRTREAVLKSLGELGDSRACEPLIELALTERQPFIRKNAIQALGEIGDPKAVPALIQMLYVELPATSFYIEARYALLQIGRAAVPELIATLTRKNEAVEKITLPSGSTIAEGAIEAKAAFVLGALKATDAEDEIVAALDQYYKKFSKSSPDSPVFASIPGAVMEMAFALGNLGGDDSVKVLERIATDTDPNIRLSATEALTVLGAKSAVPTLLKAAKKGGITARQHAIETISLLGDAKTIKAYDGLTKGGKEVPAKALKEILNAHRPRLAAAKECADKSDCWTKKLTSGEAAVRERAAFELGWAGSADAVAALLKAAEDDDPTVRMAAVISLGKLDGVQADALQKIHDTWSKKIEYKDVNAELKRLIARLRSSSRTT